jgi:hypothetical protein
MSYPQVLQALSLYAILVSGLFCAGAIWAAARALRAADGLRSQARKLQQLELDIEGLTAQLLVLLKRHQKLAGRVYYDEQHQPGLGAEQQQALQHPLPVDDSARRDELRRQLLPKSLAAKVDAMREGLNQKE